MPAGFNKGQNIAEKQKTNIILDSAILSHPHTHTHLNTFLSVNLHWMHNFKDGWFN